ncbi:scavenger receptor cysteine-rich domain-containing group B protein-like isoform X2 [Branchiostoma floridae x Branchiostoma belcheri]
MAVRGWTCVLLAAVTFQLAVAVVQKVRLADGDSESEGRVEVYDSARWFSLCGYDWTIPAARTVCRELGFGDLQFPKSTYGMRTSFFGKGSQTIYPRGFDCLPGSASLSECRETRVRCGLGDDVASVFCKDRVRLSGGAVPHQGRLEVLLDGVWTTVCGRSWGDPEAQVACRQLGFPGAVDWRWSEEYFPQAPEGVPTPQYVLACNGSERSLLSCNKLQVGDCSHSEDVGLLCEVRLVDGDTENEGRIELRDGDQWYAVCGADWSGNEAAVACRQLGFGGVKSSVGLTSSFFGRGSFPIYSTSFTCAASDVYSLTDCNTHSSTCSPNSHVAGAVCLEKIRLWGGPVPHQGRLEFSSRDGIWAPVCGTKWGEEEFRVACRHLGFPGLVTGVWARDHFPNATGGIIQYSPSCTGNENTLWGCESQLDSCTHYDDIGLLCESSVRLSGGSSRAQGRVEIYHDGTWGTICDVPNRPSWERWWRDKQARVVCQELGYLSADVVYGPGSYGDGNDLPVWLSKVTCPNNDERRLKDCSYDYWGLRDVDVSSCNHGYAVAIKCSTGSSQAVHIPGITPTDPPDLETQNTAMPSGMSNSPSLNQPRSQPLTAGTIVGIVLGALLLIVVLFVVLFIMRRKRKTPSDESGSPPAVKEENGTYTDVTERTGPKLPTEVMYRENNATPNFVYFSTRRPPDGSDVNYSTIAQLEAARAANHALHLPSQRKGGAAAMEHTPDFAYSGVRDNVEVARRRESSEQETQPAPLGNYHTYDSINRDSTGHYPRRVSYECVVVDDQSD